MFLFVMLIRNPRWLLLQDIVLYNIIKMSQYSLDSSLQSSFCRCLFENSLSARKLFEGKNIMDCENGNTYSSLSKIIFLANLEFYGHHKIHFNSCI